MECLGPPGRGQSTQEDPEENPKQAVSSGQPAAEERIHRWAGEQVYLSPFLIKASLSRTSCQAYSTSPHSLEWQPVLHRTRSYRERSRSWRGRTREWQQRPDGGEGQVQPRASCWLTLHSSPSSLAAQVHQLQQLTTQTSSRTAQTSTCVLVPSGCSVLPLSHSATLHSSS